MGKCILAGHPPAGGQIAGGHVNARAGLHVTLPFVPKMFFRVTSNGFSEWQCNSSFKCSLGSSGYSTSINALFFDGNAVNIGEEYYAFDWWTIG